MGKKRVTIAADTVLAEMKEKARILKKLRKKHEELKVQEFDIKVDILALEDALVSLIKEYIYEE